MRKKKIGMWDSISRPLPRYAKVLPLALFGQTPSNVHIKINHIEKIIKIELLITAIFDGLCIEMKVRQIFSVFSTCSFLFLECEIDPGCKQMLFLEHAQSDEWDSLLVKNY